jgi:hypothetical protein
MEAAAHLQQILPRLQQEHPGSFGTFAGRVTSARLPESGVPLAQGTAPGWTAGVESDLHSMGGFLTGVHRARGVGYADRWAKVLGNPFVNPEYTLEAAKRLGQVAQAVSQEAGKPSHAGQTMEQVVADLQRTNPEIFAPLDEAPGTVPPSRLKSRNPYRQGQ